MKSEEVLNLYNLFEENGIQIIIDGGWSVDALLETQTRPHKDLDIAVEWKNVPKLRELLSERDYKQIKEDSKWNFVLRDDNENELDVHAFIYDDKGKVVEGIMYPTESLTGTGVIDGQTVRCISPKYQVEFLAKWVHKWPEKYVDAISALCKKFDIEPPKTTKYVQ